MNEQDELIEDFIAEIKTIHIDLKVITTKLDSSKMDKALFEKFGQMVDRIYGTATTLGYTEVGKYLLAIKNISYLSSQSERELGQKKALRLMMDCVDNIEKLCNVIYKKEELKNLEKNFLQEIARAEHLSKTEFQNITRKSIAY